MIWVEDIPLDCRLDLGLESRCRTWSGHWGARGDVPYLLDKEKRRNKRFVYRTLVVLVVEPVVKWVECRTMTAKG